jgi:hypothetical protein
LPADCKFLLIWTKCFNYYTVICVKFEFASIAKLLIYKINPGIAWLIHSHNTVAYG